MGIKKKYKKEGIGLPDLPELDEPPKPKRKMFGFLKKKPKPGLPEPPVIDIKKVKEKIEKVKQDFDKQEFPKKKHEEMKKTYDRLKKKQKELDDQDRILREKDVLLSKKETELKKWDEKLKKESEKTGTEKKELDQLAAMLKEKDKNLKDREHDISKTSIENKKSFEKAKLELVRRDKALIKKDLGMRQAAQGHTPVMTIDPDLKTVLKKLDGLLEKLPDDVIRSFSKSKDFTTYEKIMKKYGT